MHNFEILQALFIETGTYNDMTIRPYQTAGDQSHIQEMQRLTEYGRHLSPSALCGIATQVLRPSAQSHSMAMIDNGWQEPRFRFIIKVREVDNHQGLTTIKILQGYTSHVGLSMHGAVDPNMLLYFNNVVVLRQVMVNSPSGNYVTSHVASADHLLRGVYRPTFTAEPEMTYLMRPEDVFTAISRQMLVGEDIMDLRLGFAESAMKKSRRRNGSAAHYLNDVMVNYRDSLDYSEFGSPLSNFAENARGNLIEGSSDQDPFLRLLKNQSVNFTNNGGIAYSELCYIFPEFDHVATLIPAKKIQIQNSGFANHQAGQTEYWTSANNETVWATILSQSVPALMMDLMLSRIAFTATNRTIGTDYFVEVADPCSFADGIDLSPYIATFKSRMVNEVLRGLSSNNLIDFAIQMVCDVLGETRINVRIAGGLLTEFVTPSCCDGLFSPVLASTYEQVETLSYDIQNMASSVAEMQSPPMYNNTNPGVNNVQNYRI
jgi:hypothetical protein